MKSMATRNRDLYTFDQLQAEIKKAEARGMIIAATALVAGLLLGVIFI